VLVAPVTHTPAVSPKETGGSPEFPDYPFAHMPRSQTPVVSRPLAVTRAGLLPSGRCIPSALDSVSRTYLLSTIIHFSEFYDAACVLASPLLRTPPLGDRTSVRLPTWWLAFGRVGLELPLTHWVTLTCFKRCLLYSHIPSLSRREHLFRSSAVPVAEAVVQSPDSASGEQTGNANPQQIVAASFNAPPMVPPMPVMMFFRVVDAETGTGLSNTKVHTAHFGGGTQDLLTDNNGVAAISYPQDTTKGNGMHVFVVAEGYVPKVVSFGNTESPEYTMKLDSALPASGLVLDEQGLPVAGVRVQILGPGVQPGQRETVDFQLCAGTSDEAGAWHFNYIPRNYTDVIRSHKHARDAKIRSVLEKFGRVLTFPDAPVYDEIRFILEKPGYAPTFPDVPVSRVDLTNLVLIINRGATIIGQITDPQARPITNALIKLLAEDGNRQQSTRTDDNGVYALTGVSTNMVGPEWTHEQPALETNSNGAVIVRSGYSFHGFYQFRSETNAGASFGSKTASHGLGRRNTLKSS
jgi:hypothetical protein